MNLHQATVIRVKGEPAGTMNFNKFQKLGIAKHCRNCCTVSLMMRVFFADVKVVFTANGNNLLADGWWGRLRHPNYLGDILMGLSWAIPAGLFQFFISVTSICHQNRKYGFTLVAWKRSGRSNTFDKMPSVGRPQI